MSTQSTPRAARSTSPADNPPNILTPGQKIKAMMAQFDSDSDSDSKISNPKASMPKLDFGSKNTYTASRALEESSDSNNDSEDADEIVRPKGRMAARMQGDASVMTKNTEPQDDSAFSRLSKTLRTERDEAQKPTRQTPSPVAESSDDELPAAISRRTNAQSSKSPVSPDPDTSKSPSRARSFSPLFVSSPVAPQNNTTDSEQITDGDSFDKPKSNARFLALVAQKRKERQERERIEEEQRAARRSQLEHFSSEILSGEESEGEEAQSALNLTQGTRKPRKASKKALEEMRQETQRMTRNMQLAHQAQTKKKITKESLFARFNFMQPEPSPTQAAAANSSSTVGSQHSSDGETAKKDKETPRTSPVPEPSDAGKPFAIDTVEVSRGLDEHIVYGVRSAALDKAHGSAPITLDEPKESTLSSAKKIPRKPTQPPVRVLLSRQEVARHQKEGYDSDDDLEVVTSPSKARRIAAFENLPTRRLQESSSMLTLKALAHLTSPTRKHTGMNSAELSASLLLKARQQAAKERRERIEELRAKGIVIETAEERAAMEDDIENMMEKARQEADEIARKEKAENKKTQGLDDDDDNDEDDEFYLPSGSDEDASNEEEDGEDSDVNNIPAFLDEEADENDESADDQAEDELSDVGMLAEAPSTRRKRRNLVVNDDEEEEPQVPSTPVRPLSHEPQTVQRPVFPGMESPGNIPMGLTQAFAGTLADDDDTTSQPASSAMPFSLPDPGLPVPRLRAEDSDILVRDSQEQTHESDFMTSYNQHVTRVSESPATHKFSQFSQVPDPTQDQGFVYSPFDPAKRFQGTPPVSTVDTVLVGQSQSPIAERKSRQLRRGRAANLSMVEEDENEGDFEINANAFNVMKKAAKKVPIAFDKKNSKAKNIVDEAAEESEDEYAGLGGASDDSEGEEDTYDQQMINDQSGEVVDEKQLAAMNAYVDLCYHILDVLLKILNAECTSEPATRKMLPSCTKISPQEPCAVVGAAKMTLISTIQMMSAELVNVKSNASLRRCAVHSLRMTRSASSQMIPKKLPFSKQSKTARMRMTLSWSSLTTKPVNPRARPLRMLLRSTTTQHRIARSASDHLSHPMKMPATDLHLTFVVHVAVLCRRSLLPLPKSGRPSHS